MPRRPLGPAGLLHVQLGSWPPWMPFYVQAASYSHLITFYFIGPPRPPAGLPQCQNCMWLTMGEPAIRRRAEQALGMYSLPPISFRKMNDLKPFLAAMFSNITSSHRWIGYSDLDIAWGNLSAEVAALAPHDDVLVPAYMGGSVANGNLVLHRSLPQYIHAYRRSPAWRGVLKVPDYKRFDEWHFTPYSHGMAAAWRSISGLRVVSTRGMLVQDFVVRTGPYVGHTLSSFGACTLATWRGGTLTVERTGPCVCGNLLNSNRPAGGQQPLAWCETCAASKAGQVFGRLHRHEEVLGLHFQIWKKGPTQNNGSTFTVELPTSWRSMPTSSGTGSPVTSTSQRGQHGEVPGLEAFTLSVHGFRAVSPGGSTASGAAKSASCTRQPDTTEDAGSRGN